MNNQQFSQRDLQVLWHPCSQMKDYEHYPMIPIKRGEGVWLEDYDGNRYIDAVSSWWVNILGHSNPAIVDAIHQQAQQLEHVIFGGFTHEPAIRLAEKLIEIAPAGFAKVFYGDNGSSAVEIALKMSFHYWRNMGRPSKSKFVSLGNSYHGETIGALSAGDVGLYKDTYQPLLFEVLTAPSPDCFSRQPGESWQDHSLRQFEKMAALLHSRHEEIAAVIVEPLVQCAGNMRMYHPIYLTRLRQLCDQLEIHLIADEIAVGFGRTGTLFACEQANIRPDFMCVSKALTGGFLPLSAVLTTQDVFDAFYDDYDTLKAFLHSHSYTGNPLACAAALATIEQLQTQQVIEQNQRLIETMRRTTEHLREHPHVGDVRQTGMILAIEMVKDKASRQLYDWRERRGMRVYEYALTQGALLRPLANVVYFMPPYVITEQQIETLAQIAERGIDRAVAD